MMPDCCNTDISLQKMLSIRVKDPAETLVALEIDGRNPYEHIRRKNSSLELFSEIEKRSALKSPTM